MKHTGTLLLLFLLFFLPVFVLLVTALAPGWRFPDVWPETFSLQAMTYLSLHKKQLFMSIGSSFLFSLLTVVATFFICLFPSAVFARTEFKGKALLEGLLLTPALVPPMTFAMGLHFLFIRFSLTESLIGVVLVLAMFSYPYMFRALVAGFQSMGEEYQICARNLGASMMTIVFRVEFPLLLPAIIAGGSVVFLVAFSEYFLVFLIGGGSVASFTGTLFPLLSSSNRSLAAILALLFLVIPIALFIVVDTALLAVYRRKGMVR
jgi:putative spermidine/putrescine transport system permease protein